jgi:molybdate transport repressor ModE-like protein
MLSVDRLRVLRAIASSGSVKAAADGLRVTTSAVSQQMAKLEQEVGQRLLERSGRGVRLTDAGERLVRHAERILSAVEAAEAELAERRGAIAGPLSITAFATAARGLVPPALRALARLHPALEIELTELEPGEAVPLVSQGHVDLALSQDWFNVPLAVPDGLVRSPLLDDIADVALPADHPLAGREVIELGEVAREPWISWPRGWICHDWLLHTLRSQGLEPRIAHKAGEHHTQLALVAAGLGIAASPRLGRHPIPAGVCIAAVRPALRRHIYGVWRADAARRPAIRVALKALRDAAARLGAAPLGRRSPSSRSARRSARSR